MAKLKLPSMSKAHKGLIIFSSPPFKCKFLESQRLLRDGIFKLKRSLEQSPSTWGCIEVTNFIDQDQSLPPTDYLGFRENKLSRFHAACGLYPKCAQMRLDELNTSRARQTDSGIGLKKFRIHLWRILCNMWIL